MPLCVGERKNTGVQKRETALWTFVLCSIGAGYVGSGICEVRDVHPHKHLKDGWQKNCKVGPENKSCACCFQFIRFFFCFHSTHLVIYNSFTTSVWFFRTSGSCWLYVDAQRHIRCSWQLVSRKLFFNNPAMRSYRCIMMYISRLSGV